MYQKEQRQAIRPTVIWPNLFFLRVYETDASMMCYLLRVCKRLFVCVCGQNTQLCLYFILSIHSNRINSRTRFCKILIEEYILSLQ
jgi:hypothetical protein